MELLDLYDEYNEALGTSKLRSAVHADGDWHRVVHIYVRNDAGQYLVHLRSPMKDGQANCWDTRFGGHVIAGHSDDETALREMEEEIGLQVKLSDLIPGGVRSYEGDWNKEHSRIYYYCYNGDIKNLHFNDNEVVRVEWLSPEEIIDSMENKTRAWAGRASTFMEIDRYIKENS